MEMITNTQQIVEQSNQVIMGERMEQISNVQSLQKEMKELQQNTIVPTQIKGQLRYSSNYP